MRGLFAITVSALVLASPATSTAQDANGPRSLGEKVGSATREVADEVKSGVQNSKRWAEDAAKSAEEATKGAVEAVKETTAKAVDQTEKAARELVEDVRKGYNDR